MPRLKANDSEHLLAALVGLPENEGWEIAQRIEAAPGCELLGGLALSVGDVETLAGLRKALVSAERWVERIAATQCVSLESDDDQFV